MELSDFWGVVNSYIDNGEHGIGINRSKIKPDTKLISISSVELNTKSNYQDFQRFQSVDVSMAADAEATLPALIEAVKSAIPNDRKAAIERRGEAAKKARAEGRARTLQLAALAWDASPISTARLVMETWGQIKDLDWSLVSSSGNVSNWPQSAVADGEALSLARRVRRLWRWLWRCRPRSVRRSPTAISVGSRSASRSDGDLMYAPGVLWTAAKHKIPLLAVMHNNRGYHQEVMHVQRLVQLPQSRGESRQRYGADRHQHHESGHRVPQARGVDGLVGEGTDQGSRGTRTCDQGSGGGGEVRPTGSRQCLDPTALTPGAPSCVT